MQLGITQHQLAEQLRVGQSTIAKIEKGSINPTYRLADKIFAYLDSFSSAKLGNVGDIATKPVISVAESDRVRKAVGIIQQHGFKQVPVIRGGTCVGSVSEKTVSYRMLERKNPASLLDRRVSQVMDEAFPAIPEDTPVTGIVSLLQSSQAILTVTKGEVTGIVTNADLLKLITKLA
ncbi:MAG: CBS domain-containing protein [Nitrososphaerota archaeon]|nr:CBS domain-containing protein [Nitrososphaerota archaeon]